MKHGNESFLIEGGLIDAPLFPEVLFHGENGRAGSFPVTSNPSLASYFQSQLASFVGCLRKASSHVRKV